MLKRLWNFILLIFGVSTPEDRKLETKWASRSAPGREKPGGVAGPGPHPATGVPRLDAGSEPETPDRAKSD